MIGSKWFLYVGLFALPGAGGPLESGLRPGERPAPYSFLVATGPKRGQSHCFVCETGARPAVIVFARDLSDPLAGLLAQLDRAMVRHRNNDICSWTTFLKAGPHDFESKLVAWGERHGINNVPLGIFENDTGPPSYRLRRQAAVTVLLVVNRKVVANFSLRQEELTATTAREILSALPRILSKQEKTESRKHDRRKQQCRRVEIKARDFGAPPV